MKNTEPASGKEERFVTIPASVIKYVRELKLTGTQYAFWHYLLLLDPFGDRWVEVPPPSELAPLFQVDARTLQRAAQRLNDTNLFEFEVMRWKAKNNHPLKPANFSTDKGIQLPSKRSSWRQKDPIDDKKIQMSRAAKIAETKTEQSFEDDCSHANECTNNRSNRSIKQEQLGTTPTTHPVPGINREIPGTAESLTTKLLRQISAAGIEPNKTIKTTLNKLINNASARAAAQSVENALSSLAEQQQEGFVKNPGGFLVAALRRGFTANDAKRNTREKQQDRPQPPDLISVEYAIDQALMRGDRAWALGKLQTLWEEGFQDQIEELCLLRKREWGFQIEQEGISDGN